MIHKLRRPPRGREVKGKWEAQGIRKETKSERWMPRLSGGEEGRGKLR